MKKYKVTLSQQEREDLEAISSKGKQTCSANSLECVDLAGV